MDMIEEIEEVEMITVTMAKEVQRRAYQRSQAVVETVPSHVVQQFKTASKMITVIPSQLKPKLIGHNIKSISLEKQQVKPSVTTSNIVTVKTYLNPKSLQVAKSRDPVKQASIIKKKKLKTPQNNPIVIEEPEGIKKCPCRYKCHIKVNVERQKELFRDYHKIESTNMKRSFLSSLIVKKNVARRRVKAEEGAPRRKNHTRVYYLPVGNGEKARVCLSFFCSIFRISTGIPGTIVKNRTANGALMMGRRSKKVKVSETESKTTLENKTNGKSIIAMQPVKQPILIEKCPCKFKCHLKISKKRQETLYRDFCDLKVDAMQKAFVSSLLVVRAVAHRKENPVTEKQRKRSCAFFLPIQNGEKARVCQKFFCSVFQIHAGIIDTIVKHRTSTGALLLKDRSAVKGNTKNRMNRNLRTKKEFQPFEQCNCKYKCHIRVNEDKQRAIYDEYRQLENTINKKYYLSSCIIEKELVSKKEVGDVVTEQKKMSRIYYLPIAEGKNARVCQKFFCNLFRISRKTIEVVIKKKNKGSPQKEICEDIVGQIIETIE